MFKFVGQLQTLLSEQNRLRYDSIWRSDSFLTQRGGLTFFHLRVKTLKRFILSCQLLQQKVKFGLKQVRVEFQVSSNLVDIKSCSETVK